MHLELDHIFILVEPEAKVADLLVDQGFHESFSRDHPGQGTSNRRFEFSNGMLEFLWVRDADEALNGPARDLNFPERSINLDASPYGIILKQKAKADTAMPFDGWSYQPDYFEPPIAFHVGANSTQLSEPLCIYAPFIAPSPKPVVKGNFHSMSHVQIDTPVQPVSEVLSQISHIDRLSIDSGRPHLMSITFDNSQSGCSKDFRPDLPLVIHW